MGRRPRTEHCADALNFRPDRGHPSKREVGYYPTRSDRLLGGRSARSLRMSSRRFSELIAASHAEVVTFLRIWRSSGAPVHRFPVKSSATGLNRRYHKRGKLAAALARVLVAIGRRSDEAKLLAGSTRSDGLRVPLAVFKKSRCAGLIARTGVALRRNLLVGRPHSARASRGAVCHDRTDHSTTVRRFRDLRRARFDDHGFTSSRGSDSQSLQTDERSSLIQDLPAVEDAFGSVSKFAFTLPASRLRGHAPVRPSRAKAAAYFSARARAA